MHLNPRRALAACLILTLFVATGCFKRPLSGVTVKSLASEVVFGVAPPEEAVAPPNTLPSDFAPFTSSDMPSFGSLPTRRERPPVAGGECPDAPLGEAPDDLAPDKISRLPGAGNYKYKYAIQLPKVGGELSGLETRTISDVRMIDPAGPNFSYKTTQKLLLAGAEVETTSTFMIDQTSPRPERRGPSAVPPVSARGMFLTSIERRVKSGTTDRRTNFIPNPPLKYMDLPAIIGAEGAFTTTSVDQRTQTVINHRGEIVRHEPVDSCGTVIDVWLVEADQTVSTPDGRSFRTIMHYGVATQLGALIGLEHIELPADDPDIILDFAIGQLSGTQG